MKTKNLIKGALAIVLCLLSFMIFRGVTNILNAFFVPLVLSIFIYNMSLHEKIAIFLALQILCFFIFPVQLIFSFFYCVIAFITTYMRQKGIRYFLVWATVTVCVTLFFYIAVRLTDLIFMTKIYEITLRVMKNNSLIYIFALFIESIIVSTLYILIFKKISSLKFMT